MSSFLFGITGILPLQPFWSSWVENSNLPPQLPGIPHCHSRPAPPLAVVDGQQIGRMLNQIAIAFQHTFFIVLPAYIYKILIYFDQLYGKMNDREKRQLIEELISEIQIYPERQPNGQWLKSIKFRLPIIEEDMNISLDNEHHVECITALTRMKP